MTREIKFRVFDKENRKWLGEDEFFITNEDVWAYAADFDNSSPLDMEKHELVQYTGLLDKNGTEIYEGDIVTDKWKDETYQVIFSDGDDIGSNGGEYSNWIAGFIPTHADGSVDTRGRCEFMYVQMIDGSAEVIGNIHDHPHLLGGVDK